MYTIVNVIYGVPLTEEVWDFLNNSDNDYDLEELGFTTEYSGSSSYPPGWCGVELDSFDESDWLDVANLKLTPTDKQRAEALDKIEALDPQVRALCPEPKTYFIFSTS